MTNVISPQQLVDIIQPILANGDSHAEQLLSELIMTQPSQIFSLFFLLLTQSPNTVISKFCLIQLQRIFVTGVYAEFDSSFDPICQQNLFGILHSAILSFETYSTISNLLARAAQFFVTHSRPWDDFGPRIVECSMSDNDLLSTTALDCLNQCVRYSVGAIPDIVDQLYEQIIHKPQPFIPQFLALYRLLFFGIDHGRSFECSEHAVATFPTVVLASELPITNFLLSEFSDFIVCHFNFFNDSIFEFLIGIVRDLNRPKGQVRSV
jgi:hypothetical protein